MQDVTVCSRREIGARYMCCVWGVCKCYAAATLLLVVKKQQSPTGPAHAPTRTDKVGHCVRLCVGSGPSLVSERTGRPLAERAGAWAPDGSTAPITLRRLGAGRPPTQCRTRRGLCCGVCVHAQERETKERKSSRQHFHIKPPRACKEKRDRRQRLSSRFPLSRGDVEICRRD